MAVPPLVTVMPTTISKVVVAANPRRAKRFIDEPFPRPPAAKAALTPWVGLSTVQDHGEITRTGEFVSELGVTTQKPGCVPRARARGLQRRAGRR
jgi:hypothetical protein